MAKLIAHYPFKGQTADDWKDNYCEHTYRSINNLDNLAVATRGGPNGYGYAVTKGSCNIMHDIKINKNVDTLSIFAWVGVPSSSNASASNCSFLTMKDSHFDDAVVFNPTFKVSVTSSNVNVNVSWVNNNTVGFSLSRSSLESSSIFKKSANGLIWIPIVLCINRGVLSDRVTWKYLNLVNGSVVTQWQNLSKNYSIDNAFLLKSATIDTINLFRAAAYSAVSGSVDGYAVGISDLRIYEGLLSDKEFTNLIKGEILHITFNSYKVEDCSGFVNNPTYTSIDFSKDCLFGSSCALFDGSTKYIKNTNDFVIPKNFSWSIWVNPKSGERFIIDMRKNDGSSNGVGIQPMYLYSDGSIQFWDSANNAGLRLASGIEFNKWQHVVVVKDNLTVKCYVNSVLKDTKSISSNACEGLVGSFYYLGERFSEATATRFSGSMDDFRMYASALTAQDVSDLYHNTLKFISNYTVEVNQLEIK